MFNIENLLITYELKSYPRNQSVNVMKENHEQFLRNCKPLFPVSMKEGIIE